jgi:uncharacterized lipoprotein YajG
MARILKGLALFLGIFMLAGCATNRGYLNINVPQEAMVQENGKQVFIRTVVDDRVFENKPTTPDIPSLGFRRGQPEDKAIKSRAIARKRNGYGKAMGDILLKENQSVESVIFDATQNSLYGLGYTVTNNKDTAKDDAILMDISIDKFWTWMNIGFWTLRIDTVIKTTLSVILPTGDKNFVIETYVKNPCQAGTSANWQKALRLAIQDYMSQVKDKLKCLESGC